MDKDNKKALKSLYLGHFIVDLYSGFVNPIMPFIAATLGMSLALSTLIIGISQMMSSFLQPVFGFISDSWKRRFFIFFGLLLSSIFTPGIGIAKTIPAFAIFLILGSIGNGFFHPQATNFMSICSSHKNLVKNMSIFLAAGTFGYSLGPIISSVILQKFSVESLQYSSIFGIIIAFCLLTFVPKISNQGKNENSFDFFKAVKEIFSSKPMIILIAFSMLKSLTAQSTTILLPFLWKDLGYSALHIGVLLFLFLINSTLGTIASPKLEKHIGTKNVILLGFFAIFPLTLIFALTYKTYPICSQLMFTLIGFFATLAVPINMILAHQVMPQHKSLTSGFITGFCWGIIGISMSLVGFCAQKFGIVNILLLTAVLPMILSVFVKDLPEKEA